MNPHQHQLQPQAALQPRHEARNSLRNNNQEPTTHKTTKPTHREQLHQTSQYLKAAGTQKHPEYE